MDPAQAPSPRQEHIFDIIVTPSEEFREGSPFPKRPRLYSTTSLVTHEQELDDIQCDVLKSPDCEIASNAVNNNTSTSTEHTPTKNINCYVVQVEPWPEISQDAQLPINSSAHRSEKRCSRNPLCLPNTKPGPLPSQVRHSADRLDRNAGDDANNNKGSGTGGDKKLGKTLSCGAAIISENRKFSTAAQAHQQKSPPNENSEALIENPMPIQAVDAIPREVSEIRNKLEGGQILCTTSSSDSWASRTDEAESDAETDKSDLSIQDEKENKNDNELNLPKPETPSPELVELPQPKSSVDLEFVFVNQNFKLDFCEPFGEQDPNQPSPSFMTGTDSTMNQLQFDLNSNFIPFAFSHHDLKDSEDSKGCYITEWTEEDEEWAKSNAKVDIPVASDEDSGTETFEVVEEETGINEGSNGSKMSEAPYTSSSLSDLNSNEMNNNDDMEAGNSEDNATYKAAASSSKFRGFLSTVNENWKKLTNGANVLRRRSSEGLIKIKNFFQKRSAGSRVSPSELHASCSSQSGEIRQNTSLHKKFVKIPLSRFDRIQVPESRKRIAMVRPIFIRGRDVQSTGPNVKTTEKASQHFGRKQYAKRLVPFDFFSVNSIQNGRKRGGEVRKMLLRVQN